MQLSIIGAGAAGCFAAANLSAEAGRCATIWEKSGKALQKVRASGGGRCNVTHELFEVPELINRYPRGPRWLKKTLHRFSPEHTVEWFAKRGVELVAEADGRMFPVTNTSETIASCLWEELQRKKVEVKFNRRLEGLQKVAGSWQMDFGSAGIQTANAVLLTTGGSPSPAGYDLLRKLGHAIETPVPSLFTFNMPNHAICALMGVAVPQAKVRICGTKIEMEGPLLVTHWGLSGPAVLRASAWGARELATRAYDFSILVNWIPDFDEETLQEQLKNSARNEGGAALWGKNPFGLPRRLWQFLVGDIGIRETTTWGNLPAGHRKALVERLLRDPFTIKGKTTFKEEFVTCGGVALSEVNPQTMESRLHPGLYFAGEVLDVDGITGGFNFQHAWASGWIAAGEMNKLVAAGVPAF